MKAWVLKNKDGMYWDGLQGWWEPLSMATLSDTMKTADELRSYMRGPYDEDDDTIEIVQVEVREIK